MTDTIEKTIRIVSFSGKQKDWRMWSAQFMARAYVKEYAGILDGTVKPPSDDFEINIGTDIGKLQMKARKANQNAYNELILSMTEEISFGLVDQARTPDLPNGDAYQAWQTTSLNLRLEPRELV